MGVSTGRRLGAAGLLASLALPGCLSAVDCHIDSAISRITAGPADTALAQAALPPPPPRAAPPAPIAGARPELVERLALPPELPGADAAPPDLGEYPRGDDPDREAKLARRRHLIDRYYQPLPPLGGDVALVPGPLDLPQLQAIAAGHNPRLRQAAADVEAARGQAVQAGLYPNPNFGFQGDQMGSAGTPGQLGVFFEQTVKTAGKLTWARTVAVLDYVVAEVALKRARVDLLTQVRRAYFAVLVAHESVRVTVALVRFTDAVYRVQVEQLRSGTAAPYEPAQLRAQAYLARLAQAQARASYLAAWKQLAAALGTPEMPPTELAGRADLTAPALNYDAILALALANHTDVVTARTNVERQEAALRSARANAVPDVTSHFNVQQDQSSEPHRVQVGLQVGMAIPVFDRNQGNIVAAQANLYRAVRDIDRARNELTATLAEAFQRYESNRAQVDLYRRRIIPDSVRAYRGVVVRYNNELNAVNLGDIVQAQQNLVTALTAYLTALAGQWQAAADVAAVLQAEDMTFLNPPPGGGSVADLLQPGGTWPTFAY